jgi:pimeloyl-ACP methyl ester carboxylesterase
MKQIATYKSGFSLSYAEYGDKNGYPILIQHGLIASIADFNLFEGLLRLGTRLICIARPGYGESSPYIMQDMAEWGAITAVLVNELGLASFDVLGLSSGAPYSYSIGYQFPDKVRNIFILSGTPALYDEKVLACWPYPVQKQASLAEMQTLAHELFFANLSEAALAQNDIKDASMNNCFGIAQDFKLRCVNWGFRLAAVNANVYMRHSKSDDSVPFVTAEMTSKLFPNCKFEVRENDAHFSNEVLDDFIETVMARHYEQAEL